MAIAATLLFFFYVPWTVIVAVIGVLLFYFNCERRRIFRTVACVYVSPLVLYLVYLPVSALGFLPFPRQFDRSFRHPSDYRIMRSLFGYPFPESFSLDKVCVPAIGPIPSSDGTDSAYYLVSMSASDFARNMKNGGWKRPDQDQLNHLARNNALSYLSPNWRGDDAASGMNEGLPTRWILFMLADQPNRRFASMVVDLKSTPDLRLYLETGAP